MVPIHAFLQDKSNAHISADIVSWLGELDATNQLIVLLLLLLLSLLRDVAVVTGQVSRDVCRHHFQGIIDYIFFSRDFMRPLRVMGPTDITWFERNKVIGCPHPHIPSDHLPLMIQVQLTTPISLASPPSQAQSEIPMTSLEFPATSESLLVKQSPTTAADTLPVFTDETTL